MIYERKCTQQNEQVNEEMKEILRHKASILDENRKRKKIAKLSTALNSFYKRSKHNDDRLRIASILDPETGEDFFDQCKILGVF